MLQYVAAVCCDGGGKGKGSVRSLLHWILLNVASVEVVGCILGLLICNCRIALAEHGRNAPWHATSRLSC